MKRDTIYTTLNSITKQKNLTLKDKILYLVLINLRLFSIKKKKRKKGKKLVDKMEILYID